MKINIISVGSFKNRDNCGELFEEYRKRIRWNINLIEVKNSQAGSIEERKNQENRELIKRLDPENKLIVLDERGSIITTEQFGITCKKYIEISKGIDFVIGGSEGLLQEIRNKADFVLSFGKMVFPHLLVRVMIIEQLYRVYSMTNNHPYHRN
jgi:23S rRNA (pseudouridine1915-N3)-methyltransferase